MYNTAEYHAPMVDEFMKKYSENYESVKTLKNREKDSPLPDWQARNTVL